MICLHFIDSCSEEQDRALWICLNEKCDSVSLFCLDGEKYLILFYLFFFSFAHLYKEHTKSELGTNKTFADIR